MLDELEPGLERMPHRTGGDDTLEPLKLVRRQLRAELDGQVDAPRDRVAVVVDYDDHVAELPVLGRPVLDDSPCDTAREGGGQEIVGGRAEALAARPDRLVGDELVAADGDVLSECPRDRACRRSQTHACSVAPPGGAGIRAATERPVGNYAHRHTPRTKRGSSLSDRPDARGFGRTEDAAMQTSTLSWNTRSALETTRVADAMTSGLIHCAPETPLRTVAGLMATHHVHAVYVFDYGIEDDEAVRLWGIVSDLDLIAGLPVLDERTAGDSAVTPLLTISLEEPLARAAQMMAEAGSTHLAVLDPANGRPAGVLSTLDIARVLAGGLPGK